jgi:hypothetical protein
MKNKILNSDISILGLDDSLQDKLRINELNMVNEVWSLDRKELKSLQLSDSEINQIIIKLQLNGVDLNKRVYTSK